MKTSEPKLSPDALRETLQSFWASSLEITVRNGDVLATLPLLYPDGMQVVVSLTPVTRYDVTISDFGRTISKLEGHGVDLSLQRNAELVSERIKTFELHQKGYELYKIIRFPVEGLDVQLFGEALVSISHLIYRHEISTPRLSTVYSAVRNILSHNHFVFKDKEKAFVNGRIEGPIKVDFLTVGKHAVACKAIERKRNLRDYVEKWGFLWRDAKDHDPTLVNSMFYDPHNQDWDDATRNIGRNICDIFEPYFEKEKINKALEPYRNGDKAH